MHQIIKNVLKIILPPKKKIYLYYIYENKTLSIDFYIELMRSYLYFDKSLGKLDGNINFG